MDMFVIRGGRPLRGRVAVGGAKNSALPIMAAALAADGPTVLHGVPHLADVDTLCRLLETLGMRVGRGDESEGVARPDRREGRGVRGTTPFADSGRATLPLHLEVFDETLCSADYDLVRRMRASFCVLGPLLARRGRACVSLPGGCAIGDRPIDLHLKGLNALGADIRVERGYVIAEAKRLRGASIYLGGPFGSTVTGTCNVMTAAALADGITTIESAACEPEVFDLGNYLNAMGAKITGLGTPFLRIEGVDRLRGAEHTIIPDRIEAATLMIAAALTGGEIELDNVCPAHMTAVIEKLREIGVAVRTVGRALLPGPSRERSGNGGWLGSNEVSPQPSVLGAPLHSDPSHPIHTSGTERSRVRVAGNCELRPADCIALPYPGIPTDVQAQLMALLSRAAGMSIITDKVFPDRFMHAAELNRLGARIRREGNSAIINGVSRLSGACVMASDLRASAALVLAALAAEGESVVRRIYHLDRGYDRLEAKLNQLGADVRRLHDDPANMPRFLTAAPRRAA